MNFASINNKYKLWPMNKLHNGKRVENIGRCSVL